jgi:hypothetical protein
MQRHRPALVDSVWVSAELEETHNRFLLRDRVPPRASRDAIDRVMEGHGAAAIGGHGVRAGVHQLADKASSIRSCSDVQRGVAGVHVVIDLVEVVLPGGLPGRPGAEARHGEIRLGGE